MVSAGLFAASNFDRESAMSLKMLSSCVAYPFTVSTRLGIRSLRRWIWFCTSPHAPLIASSCVVNLLYEHPDNVTAITASTNACSDLRINLSSRFPDSPILRYQLPEAPPPPERPPPNPPKPPPPDPPPPPNPPIDPPKPPPPNPPAPPVQLLHGPAPQ